MKIHAFNLLYYTPSPWEQIVLWFCPLRQHESHGSVVWYKRFYNRIYIYGYIHTDMPETYTSGSNSAQGYENAGNN